MTDLQRRVAGRHDIRLDGMIDLLARARGASVFDIGCNRGHVALDFYRHYASVVHGCDNFAEGIETARHNFADKRDVESKFEVVDLTRGPRAVAEAFGDAKYDIVLLLATYHKLKRVMDHSVLTALLRDFGRRTTKYLAWRATSDKPDENEQEMLVLDQELGQVGLKRIHTSYISDTLGQAAIWRTTK